MKKVVFMGRTYPLVGQGEWSYDDAEMAQRVSGLTVGQMALGILANDIRVAKAFAAVSLSRAGVHIDAEDGAKVAVDIDNLGSYTMDQLIVDFTGDVPDPEEEPADDPPAGAAAGDEADAAATEGTSSRSRRRTSTGSSRATRGTTGTRS